MHTPHSDLVFSEMKLVTPQQKKHAAQRCQQSVSTMPAAAVYIIIIFLYYIYFTGLWERPGTGTGKLTLCTHPHNTQDTTVGQQRPVLACGTCSQPPIPPFPLPPPILLLYNIYFTGLWERSDTGTGKLTLATHPHNIQDTIVGQQRQVLACGTCSQPPHPNPPATPPPLCLYYTYRMCQVINRCAGLQVGEPISHT